MMGDGVIQFKDERERDPRRLEQRQKQTRLRLLIRTFLKPLLCAVSFQKPSCNVLSVVWSRGHMLFGGATL